MQRSILHIRPESSSDSMLRSHRSFVQQRVTEPFAKPRQLPLIFPLIYTLSINITGHACTLFSITYFRSNNIRLSITGSPTFQQLFLVLHLAHNSVSFSSWSYTKCWFVKNIKNLLVYRLNVYLQQLPTDIQNETVSCFVRRKLGSMITQFQ